MRRGWDTPSKESLRVFSAHSLDTFATGRERSVEYATSIWSTASLLSNGDTGTCETPSAQLYEISRGALRAQHSRPRSRLLSNQGRTDRLPIEVCMSGSLGCVGCLSGLHMARNALLGGGSLLCRMAGRGSQYRTRWKPIECELYRMVDIEMQLTVVSSKHFEYGRCAYDNGPENVRSICSPYLAAHCSFSCLSFT